MVINCTGIHGSKFAEFNDLNIFLFLLVNKVNFIGMNRKRIRTISIQMAIQTEMKISYLKFYLRCDAHYTTTSLNGSDAKSFMK